MNKKYHLAKELSIMLFIALVVMIILVYVPIHTETFDWQSCPEGATCDCFNCGQYFGFPLPIKSLISNSIWGINWFVFVIDLLINWFIVYLVYFVVKKLTTKFHNKK